MGERPDISVVISTYNRCDTLRAALESVTGQEAGSALYEIIVVDNNSTDRTRQVVESFAARGGSDVRYVFERRQGVSHGRNAGIVNARASLIAFLDDDECAAVDWVAAIKKNFDAHPEADFVAGKILPRWNRAPPPWLTCDVWVAPLALVDCGDEPFYSTARSAVFFPSANFSFRRAVFDRIGMFDPRFQQVKGWVSSTEDSELLLRVWRAGGQGLYAPDAVVFADVQVERMTKQYFRRWHTSRGRYNAMMRLHEVIGAHGLLSSDEEANLIRLFGTPAYVYRELLTALGRYATAALSGRETRALKYELEVRQTVSYLRERYKDYTTEHQHSCLAEIASFAMSMKRKKLSRR